MTEVFDLLSTIEDTRDSDKVIYPLPTLLFISICAIFSGAESWDDIVVFAESRREWLSKYVTLNRGIPCYSTFRRLFVVISPTLWSTLIEGTLGLVIKERIAEDHIPIDGKTLKGSRCESKEIRAIQMVSAWSFSNKLVLADVTTDSKSNEIKAIPLLLDLLELDGCTVSIDAMGCQSVIMESILSKGGDYVIGLKKNQPSLYTAVVTYSKEHGEQQDNLIEDHFDDSHGRLVRRRYFAFALPEEAKPVSLPGIKTIIATETISSEKNKPGTTTAEWRYYVSSHESITNKLASYVRNHWSIESEYHWELDVHLHDDADKKHDKNAATNFAKTKRLLLSLVKSKMPEGKKRSVRSRLKRVGWDLDYLMTLLLL
jgi:predicted transposase YbfD/YdcC